MFELVLCDVVIHRLETCGASLYKRECQRMHTHDMEDIDHGNVYYVFVFEACMFDVIECLLKLVVVTISQNRLDWW